MKRFRRNITVRQRPAQLLQITYIFIFITLLLASCTTETGRMLRHADSIMEEYPDSAMSILKGIDRKGLTASDFPYYALLYTQAQVKTDVPLDVDSLISIAYAKYGDKTSGDLGIRSNFYNGEVFFNQENYREAMPYYLTAYEESKRIHNDYWRAKAAERISNIFFYIYNYDEASEYIEEAAYYYNCVGRTRNHRFALSQLANILLNNGNPDRAYELLDSLKTLTLKQHPVDSIFLEYIKFPFTDAMTQTGRISEERIKELDMLSTTDNDLVMLDAAVLQSKAYEALDKPEVAKNILDVLGSHAHSTEDKIHIIYARYENAKAIGDSALAISLVDSMLYYQNAVAEDIIKESVMGAQSDFYSQMAIRHEERSHFLKWMLVLGIIIFVLVLVSVMAFLILKNKAKDAKLQAQLETFLSIKIQSAQNPRKKLSLQEIVLEIGNQKESMSNQIQSLQDVNTGHNEIIEKLFKEKWDTLDTLCDQYYGLDNSELNAKDLVANMQKELKKVISKKGLKQIVDAVDLYMGGIVNKLRTQCPFLKESDISFLALLYAGFSTRAVCMFSEIKYDYFYVKKSRLIKRIEASNAPDKSIFLQKLK